MEDGSHNYHRFLHGDNDGMVELTETVGLYNAGVVECHICSSSRK